MALRDRMLAMAPTPRARATLAGLCAALAALTALVAGGALTRIDQFSLDHLMPWLVPDSPAGSATAGLYRPFTLRSALAIKFLDLWVYPCSVLVSGVIVAVACFVLWRRIDALDAFAPAVAWVVGNAIEVLGKHTIVRPALYGTANGIRIHVTPFDDSFPSGHMMRGVLAAGAIVLVWKRASPWAIVWLLTVGPALVVQAAHTITDVVGGALVGLILLIPVLAIVQGTEPPDER